MVTVFSHAVMRSSDGDGLQTGFRGVSRRARRRRSSCKSLMDRRGFEQPAAVGDGRAGREGPRVLCAPIPLPSGST
jgi:hypothetical protein